MGSKTQGGTGKDIANTMGIASGVASVIPGIGPVLGAGLGLGSQVLSWILGQDKYDWDKWKKEQKGAIDFNYNQSLSRATDQANKTANATIGQTTNAQGLASGVAGMSGVGRINAQTYANIAENRDSAVTGITNALEQNRAAMLSSVDRQAAEGSMTEDFNAPNTMTYVDNFMKSLQSPVMQEGIGAIIGGLGKGANWLGGLFRGGATNTGTNTGTILNTIGSGNKSQLTATSPSLTGGYDKPTLNNISGSMSSMGKTLPFTMPSGVNMPGILKSKYKYNYLPFTNTFNGGQ